MPTGKHSIMLGDILPPLNGMVVDYGNPVDLDNYTPKFRLLTLANAVVLNDVTTGLVVHPTQVFTVDTTRDVIKCDAHGVKEGDQVKLASTTTIPAGLTASIWLFAINVTPNEFQVALTPNGPVIDITSTGSGTHTLKIRGTFQMDFGATEVDEAGPFKGFIRLYTGSEFSTFPKGQGEYIPIEVVALGT